MDIPNSPRRKGKYKVVTLSLQRSEQQQRVRVALVYEYNNEQPPINTSNDSNTVFNTNNDNDERQ